MNNDKCILWTGRVNEYGYGTIGVSLAHRRAWEEANGPIPKGLVIDHICHDPDICRLGVECPHRKCVNVAHMKVVTAKENRERTYSAFGIKTHCPKGHAYEGDNLLISDGRRYCRACKRENQKNIRRAESLRKCEESGHERVLVTDARGHVYCQNCRGSQTNEVPRLRRSSDVNDRTTRKGMVVPKSKMRKQLKRTSR